jgi:glucose/arabinose dehydrogenase
MFPTRLFSLLAVAAVTTILAFPGAARAEAYRLETWTDGLDLPWSIAFLPDESALITELGGRLKRTDATGRVVSEIGNVPEVYFAGQGGLFDVALHPGFAENQLIYLSFAEGAPDNNGTAVARARLGDVVLEDVEIIFRNFTRKDTSVHYGGRLAFLPDGTLLLTTGDGFDYRESAQDMASGLGKVLRMNDDGSPAAGNPFPDSPYVYAYGLRNPQGLAVTDAGIVWLHEHGPRGGDELNRIEAGVNYGWPAITYGMDYSGAVISPYTEWEGMARPVHFWVPSIAPSGLAVYQGERFPGWTGNLFVGALVNREVRRLELSGGRVEAEEAVFGELDARIRDVRNGPGDTLYILTPDRVVRVMPASSGDAAAN